MKISPPPSPKSPPIMPVRKPAIAKLMVAHGQPAPQFVQHVPWCITTPRLWYPWRRINRVLRVLLLTDSARSIFRRATNSQ